MAENTLFPEFFEEFSGLDADAKAGTRVVRSQPLRNPPNRKYGDGRVQWVNGANGYVCYGWYEGQVFWHYAQW